MNLTGRTKIMQFFLRVSCVFLTVLTTACFMTPKKPDYINPEPVDVLENQTFNKTLSIYGDVYDGIVIRNCVFEDIEGSALDIRGADNVVVENCQFRNIHGNGITLQGRSPTTGIVIRNNDIAHVDGNGIYIRDTHKNVTVTGNTITDSALDFRSSMAGMPHHGIYSQGENFEITNNMIDGVKNPGGHGISLRSWGLVQGNDVKNVIKSGIGYFPDHPGAGGILQIIGNTVETDKGNGVRLSDNGNKEYYVDEIIVKDNFLRTADAAVIAIENFSSGIDIRLLDNDMARSDQGTLLIYDKRE